MINLNQIYVKLIVLTLTKFIALAIYFLMAIAITMMKFGHNTMKNIAQNINQKHQHGLNIYSVQMKISAKINTSTSLMSIKSLQLEKLIDMVKIHL